MIFAISSHASGDTWAADVAIVSFSARDREHILNRRAIFLGLRGYDPQLNYMEFSDYSAEWYDWDFNADESGTMDDVDVLPDYTGPIHGDAVSVKCPHMVVSEDGVHWRCWTKHGDVRLFTSTIPWDLLEGKK